MDQTMKDQEVTTKTDENLPSMTSEKTSTQIRDEILAQQQEDSKNDPTEETPSDVTEIQMESGKENTTDDAKDLEESDDEDSDDYDPFETNEEEEPQDKNKDEEEEIDEETLAMNKLIDERVREGTKEYKEKMDRILKENAFNEFINSKEGKKFEPFKEDIKRYLHDEKLKGFRFEAIGYMIAGPKLMKLGAERYKAALEKSQKSRLGSNSPRKGEPSETTALDKLVSTADAKTFSNFTEQVKAGKIKVV